MNTGADCDDRQEGSVAAGWQDVRPAAVVDLLVKRGWQRTDPATGPPEWYLTNAPAGWPIGRCLTQRPEGWQPLDRDEFPSPACSHPSTTWIVLTATRGDRHFVARINLYGMTVDVAHT